MRSLHLNALRLILLLVVTGSVFAQPAETAPPVRRDPYVSGETLTYIGKYKKFGIPFTIAELTFKVAGESEAGTRYIVSEANSKGTLSKLFNFKFYLKIDTVVNSETLSVKETRKRDEQGDRIRDSIAEFDYAEKRVMYTETDPNEPTKAPRRVASSIALDTQDVVSAVYRLRGLDLEIGKELLFKVSDSGLVYDIPVKVTGREEIKSEAGKRFCWKVEPQVFGEGRIIEQKGSLTIWISDDDDRVPVLAKLETTLGDVEIKLKEFSNIRSSAPVAK
ncbi:MAG: DUF3108 domain-containing protein [Pyrinomonadaceae bacterium]